MLDAPRRVVLGTGVVASAITGTASSRDDEHLLTTIFVVVFLQRASEGNSGDGGNFSGVDASSILAALPPGIGQAASALTSFASSFKRSGATEEDGTGEGHPGEQGEHHEHHNQEEEDVKKEGEAVEGQYELHHPEGASHGENGDEYRNEAELSSTAAAIAAMESLAAQGLQMQEPSQQGKAGRSKKETGPDAERARKDNHKEVERKRREQISNGISELAAIVPGCDAKGVNKTAVINAAVRYIQELKNNEASNIEKWTLEKLLMDQAMNDLNQHLEANRKEVIRLRAQLGIEGEPEEVKYHHAEEEHHENANDEGASLDPNLETAAREGAAASALSEVAAVAAAAAAEAEQASVEANLEADKEIKEKVEAVTRGGRSRAHPESQVKEETGRAKRARH